MIGVCVLLGRSVQAAVYLNMLANALTVFLGKERKVVFFKNVNYKKKPVHKHM